MKKQIIYGCESRGDAQSAYLTRYAFPRLGPVRPALHIFHRSDADELHDHPWPFVSIVLWRGYIEETPTQFAVKWDAQGREVGQVDFEHRHAMTKRKRVWPGAILFRSATHVHRVELVDEKPAVTLVFFGVRCRNWGFFTRRGWQLFSDHFTERGC